MGATTISLPQLRVKPDSDIPSDTSSAPAARSLKFDPNEQPSTTRELPLTRGYSAIVDDSDYEEASQHKWSPNISNRTVYAVRSVRVGKKLYQIALHRQIMNCPPGLRVDHIDGNGLNCTRNNMRIATLQENSSAIHVILASSGYKSVHWEKRRQKFAARIKQNQKTIHLGYFIDPAEAALAYDRAARDLFGEFAVTNFLEDGVTRNPLLSDKRTLTPTCLQCGAPKEADGHVFCSDDCRRTHAYNLAVRLTLHRERVMLDCDSRPA